MSKLNLEQMTNIADAELRDKILSIANAAEANVKLCMETECGRPKMKPKHRCAWHAEAVLPPDQRAQRALERRTAWDGTRSRGDGSCAGCGAPDVPADYLSGSRCKSCAVLDRRRTEWKLSDEQQHALFNLSGGKCMGCGRHQQIKSLAVEHDHSSGEIRGLTEQECNGVIGVFRDDPYRFLRIALYLINPPARQVIDPENYMSQREMAARLIEMCREIWDE